MKKETVKLEANAQHAGWAEIWNQRSDDPHADRVRDARVSKTGILSQWHQPRCEETTPKIEIVRG